MADAFAADFVNEFVEAGGVGQIHVGVGLDAVAVATGDGDLVPLAREDRDGCIFLPGAETIELQRVDVLAVDGEELVDRHAMPVRADAVEVPKRVVEDEKHAWNLVELRKDLGQQLRVAALDGKCRELGEALLPSCSGCAGQVMNAEMKGGRPEGHGPLQRDRDVAGGVERAQEHRRFDVVVVRDRDEGGELKLVLDLLLFEIEGKLRGQRRGPVALRILGADAGLLFGAVFGPAHDGQKPRPVLTHLGDEIQRLFRLIGVAVERHSPP